MILIQSKRRKPENILKEYPDAIIADVTSHAKDGLVKLSPFYPHGGYTCAVHHYNMTTGILEHSCTTHLTDFSKPPYLISTNVPLEEVGFRGGVFTTDKDSLVFAASDALSHYILMMYELSKCNEYHEELKELRDQSSLNAQLLMTAEKQKIDFKNNVIDTLFSKMKSPEVFTEYMKELYCSGVVDIDDYTLVVM